MRQILFDTIVCGTFIWLAGYLASLAVLFSDLEYAVWGKIVLVLFIPLLFIFTFWHFQSRDLPLRYYAGVGIAWGIIAVLLDIPFIVIRFNAGNYYGPDVFCYYGATVLIPVAAGLYVRHVRTSAAPGNNP
ncbi:MAG: hypothetical protein GYA23_05570 [Methanomicrobiales archaeon]|nr:hypothetical protein [Methanomicrobiales archaeon]